MPIITNVRLQPRRPIHLGVYTTAGFFDGYTRESFQAVKWPKDWGTKPTILTVNEFRVKFPRKRKEEIK